jgi:hypothetical protein
MRTMRAGVLPALRYPALPCPAPLTRTAQTLGYVITRPVCAPAPLPDRVPVLRLRCIVADL